MPRGLFQKTIITAAFLLMILLISTGTAFAHKGHDGPPKVFMEEKEALKTMLPEGGKVVRRKEELKKEKYNEALKQWGYSPETGVHSYFLSKGQGGEVLGTLFIHSVEYGHGEIVLATGYDKDGHLSGLKLLSSPGKHLKEVTDEVLNSGFLDKFLHLKTEDVIAAGKSYRKEPEGSLRHILAREIGGTAILLKIFQGL